MNEKILWQNLNQMYADLSEYADDFASAGDLDEDAQAAGLRELTAAKLEMSAALHMVREAVRKVSRIFSWHPDDPAANLEETEDME